MFTIIRRPSSPDAEGVRFEAAHAAVRPRTVRPPLVGAGRTACVARVVASCAVVVSSLSGGANATAAEERGVKDIGTAKLLEALEERQMSDVALWVLKRIESDPDASADLKREVPFRRAAALVGTTRTETNPARRAEVYDQATKEIDAFLKANPEGERALQAYLQKGNLLIERGRSKLDQAKRPGEDAAKLRAEALPFFESAIKVLEGPDRKPADEINAVANAEDAVLKLLRGVDASLKELRGEAPADKADGDKDEKKDEKKEGAKPTPKPKKPVRKPGSAKQMADLEERQDDLRGQLLKTRLLIAAAYYEKSRALEPKSDPWKKALGDSAARYKELYDKYRARGAGLFARYYEGRNYAALGDRAKALATLADIRGLEGDGGIVPGLRAKAINSSLECWLEDKKYDEFDERLLKLSLAPLSSDRIDADWLGMKIRAAQLLERKAAAIPEKEKAKKSPLLRDAKRLAMEVAKVNKDFAAEARTLLADLGKQLPDDGEGAAATFEAAMDSARASLAAMQARQGTLKQAEAAKDAAAVEAAKKDIGAERGKAAAALRRALSLAGPDDIDAANQARYLLTYLLYEEQRLHEAASLGEFLVDRYPNSRGSRPAGRIAMASWQLLQKQPVAGWAEAAKGRCVDVARRIMRTWPDSPEAADAAVVAIAAATEARDPDGIVAILEQVPESSPRRSEVMLRAGGALWREVQEKTRLEEALRPKPEALARWRKLATKAIDDGLAAPAAGQPTASAASRTVAVAAALARCQMAMDEGDTARVAALLEHPVYGPWTLLNGSDKTFAQGPLATATATAALRHFIEKQQNDKAVLAMKKLEELAGAAGAEASARLTGMYQSMGRDLQEQLTNLGSGPSAGTPETKARAAAILTGFEKFLEGVAKDPKPSSQMWVATTYLSLGSGEGTGAVVPKAQAEGYLDRAADIYEKLLEKGGADIAKFEPSIRLKMANVYREREKWEEAQKQFDWILSDPRRQNTLDFQIQAAEMLQAAAAAAADKTQKATFLAQAINGYKRPGKPKEAWAWGWAVLSNRLEAQAFNGADEKAMEARDRFYQARLNVLKCRLERAEALPQDRDTELQKAFDYVDFTFKTHPDLGGPAMRKQFDKLLKEIEKRQNKPVQKGVDGLKEAAEALSAAG
jgi:hypothetical protein